MIFEYISKHIKIYIVEKYRNNMKKVTISQAIDHWLAQLENKWAQISQNIAEQTRTELSKVIDTIKVSLPNEPGLAFLVSYDNFGKFYNLIEGAEQGQYPIHTTAEMLSCYMRLGASINDKCRGYKTGRI